MFTKDTLKGEFPGHFKLHIQWEKMYSTIYTIYF